MNVLNTLQFIAAFNFLLLGLLILLNHTKVTYGVKLLGIFLIAKGVTLFTNLNYIMNWEFNGFMISVLSSTLFLYAPFLYFFAKYLVSKAVIEVKKDWVHFIPFGIYFIYNVFYGITAFESAIADYTITSAYYLQSISYTLMAFSLIQKKSKTSQSQVWLKYLLLSFLVVWIMFLTQIIFSLSGQADIAIIFKTLGVISILILANLTIVIAMYSPELFFKGLRVINKTHVENTIMTESNYQKLLGLMSEKELYTNPSLKLSDLSNAIGFSERNTSLLISQFHKGNFSDFLNSFRIEAAKRLFVEKQNELTISEVLYIVGFNSKSVFNTLFKKKVGMTPSAFKKSQIKVSSVG